MIFTLFAAPFATAEDTSKSEALQLIDKQAACLVPAFEQAKKVGLTRRAEKLLETAVLGQIVSSPDSSEIRVAFKQHDSEPHLVIVAVLGRAPVGMDATDHAAAIGSTTILVNCNAVGNKGQALAAALNGRREPRPLRVIAANGNLDDVIGTLTTNQVYRLR